MSRPRAISALLFLSRHRMSVLFVVALISAIAFVQSSRVVLDDNYLVMLPIDDPVIHDFMAYNAAFKQLDRMVFDVSTPTEDPVELTDAADAFHEGLVATGEFDRTTYQLAPAGQTELVETFLASMPALMDEDDLREIEPMLTSEKIGEHLTQMRKELAGPNGVFLKHVIPYDPIGVLGNLMRRLEVLRAGVGDANIADNRIVSADRRHVMILAEPSFPSSNYNRSAELIGKIDGLARKIAADHPENPPHFSMIGGHRATLDNITIIQRDIARTLTVGLVMMIALCLVAYRRRWLAFATVLPATFGGLIAGLLMSSMHEAIYSISVAFGIVLMGITADYAIHVIYHLENHPRSSPRKTAELVAQIAGPIAMGASTTMGAFALMMLSPVRAHRQVGLFSAVGIVSAAVFSIAILPLLIPGARIREGNSDLLPLSKFFRRIMQWRNRHTAAVIAVALIFTAVCLVGIGRLRFQGDLERVNGVSPETNQAMADFRKTWGDNVNQATIMVEGKDEEDALAKNDTLARLLGDLERKGIISGISSISSLAPSEQTQRQNMESWRKFWTPEKTEHVRSAVLSKAKPLGYRADAFAPFFKLIETGGSLFSIADLNKGPLGAAMEQRMTRSGRKVFVTTLLKFEQPGANALVRQMIAENLPGAALVQARGLMSRISDLARTGLGFFALLAMAVVLIVLLGAFGSIELAAVTFVPILISILWTFGVMGFVGLPVDLFNSIFIIFIVGVGDDFSIFLVTARLARLRGEIDRLDASGGVITICALTTISGCGVLMIARHPALFSIGAASMLGMSFVFISSLVFAPLGASILLSRASTSGAPRLLHLLGGMWIFTYAFFAQVILFLGVLPILRWKHRREPSRILPRLREFGRMGLRNMLTKFPYGSVSYGNVTAETFKRPTIVISNHESSVDIPLIASLPGDIRLTLKPRVANAPWLGISARKLGHIVLRPGDPGAALAACRATFAEGASVHFFPEATRSTDGFGRRFHKGAFELAVELGCDILPIVVCDTGACVPRDGYWVEHPKMRVHALDRITPENFDYSRGARELMHHAQRLIVEGRQAELDQNNTPDHVRRKVARRYRYLRAWIEVRVAHSLRTDPAFSELDTIVPRVGNLLEVGCGIGIYGHWLTEFCNTRRYLGVDSDEEAIGTAQRSLLGKRHAQFERRDIDNWQWPMSDAIILSRGLEEVEVAEKSQTLAKAFQALNPGGLLVIRHKGAAPKGKEPLDSENLATLLRDAGFSDVEPAETDNSDESVFVRARRSSVPIDEA